MVSHGYLLVLVLADVFQRYLLFFCQDTKAEIEQRTETPFKKDYVLLAFLVAITK